VKKKPTSGLGHFIVEVSR